MAFTVLSRSVMSREKHSACTQRQYLILTPCCCYTIDTSDIKLFNGGNAKSNLCIKDQVQLTTQQT